MIFQAQTGDFTCTSCRRKKTRDEMASVTEREEFVEDVGTLYVRKGVCLRCSPTPKKEKKAKKVRKRRM